MCTNPWQGYQPTLLALRADVPAFDERFRGNTPYARGAQAADSARHLSVAVHPGAFVLSLPAGKPRCALAAEAAAAKQVRMNGLVICISPWLATALRACMEVSSDGHVRECMLAQPACSHALVTALII